MKQLYLKTLVSLLLCLTAGSAMAYDCEVDGIFYNLNQTGMTAEVTNSNDSKYSGDIVIPSSINYNGNQYSVTSIGVEAFLKCRGLTSINIPNSVTSIGGGAFEGCSLTSIIIPNSVTSIGDYAFNGCIGLTSITLPPNISFIGAKAFASCMELSDVLSYIMDPFDLDESVFQNINSQASLQILYGTKEKYLSTRGWKDAFSKVRASIAYIDGIRYSVNGAVPEDKGDPYTAWVKSAPKWTVYSKSVKIPSTITIGEETFTVVGIDDGAFKASQITTVIIPNSIKKIDDSAFKDCKVLNRVRSCIKQPFPISSSVFRGIPSDAILYVPIGTKALYESALGWNILDESTPEKKVFASIKEVERPEEDIYADGDYFTSETPDGKVLNYQVISAAEKTCAVAAYNKVSGELVIPENAEGFRVEKIGDYAFKGCSDLTSVTIPNSVTRIGYYTFSNCIRLNSITIGKGVRQIGSMAFESCYSLKKVIISDLSAWCYIGITHEDANGTVTSSSPFYYGAHLYSDENTEIRELFIPNNVLYIENGAFINCQSLTSVTIPNSVKGIGYYAFSGCSALSNVVIPNSVKTINKYAFANCLSLYSVTSLITLPFKLDETTFRCTDKNYNEDIIYMAATLYVPRGRQAMYSNIEGWQKFMNIVETDTKFNLTYYLDGELYKNYEIQATEVITPEPDPYKKGYIFSGWSAIPYLMPAQNVAVYGSFTVDPDYNGVAGVTNDATTPTAYYSIDGQRHDSQKKGLNIIRMSDGTVRKVMAK